MNIKVIATVLGAIVLLAAAFWGGTMYANLGSGTAARAGGALAAGGPGGPMANLTAEEQAEIQNMTEEERQAFFQEKMGDAAPAGAAPGGMRGGTLEGEVVEVAEETLTIKLANGGSQTVYTDDATIVAYAEGASPLAAGASIIVFAQPEADGVNTATAIVVK